jgi:hypothetical protein
VVRRRRAARPPPAGEPRRLAARGLCAGDYSLLAYRYGHHSLPLGGAAAIVATIAAVAPILVLPLPILLFPDGRLPRRWRAVLRCYLVASGLYVAALLASGVIAVAQGHDAVDSSGKLVAVGSPTGGGHGSPTRRSSAWWSRSRSRSRRSRARWAATGAPAASSVRS